MHVQVGIRLALVDGRNILEKQKRAHGAKMLGVFNGWTHRYPYFGHAYHVVAIALELHIVVMAISHEALVVHRLIEHATLHPLSRPARRSRVVERVGERRGACSTRTARQISGANKRKTLFSLSLSLSLSLYLSLSLFLASIRKKG